MLSLTLTMSQQSYKGVSVDDVVKSNNPLEVYARNTFREAVALNHLPPQMDFWNISAHYKGGEHKAIGYTSFEQMMNEFVEDLALPKGPFSGLVLHAYCLLPHEQNYIMRQLQIPDVALLTERPEPKKSNPLETEMTEIGGLTKRGGTNGLHSLM